MYLTNSERHAKPGFLKFFLLPWCIYAYTHALTHTHTCKHTYTHTRARTHIPIYTHPYTHIQTQTKLRYKIIYPIKDILNILNRTVNPAFRNPRNMKVTHKENAGKLYCLLFTNFNDQMAYKSKNSIVFNRCTVIINFYRWKWKVLKGSNPVQIKMITYL